MRADGRAACERAAQVHLRSMRSASIGRLRMFSVRIAINGSLLPERRVIRETVMASSGVVEPATPLQSRSNVRAIH
jgi:hypothetical protein